MQSQGLTLALFLSKKHGFWGGKPKVAAISSLMGKKYAKRKI